MVCLTGCAGEAGSGTMRTASGERGGRRAGYSVFVNELLRERRDEMDDRLDGISGVDGMIRSSTERSGAVVLRSMSLSLPVGLTHGSDELDEL